MANSIKIGGFSFDALKIGGSDVDAAYIGDTLVYSGGTTPPTPSYKWLATYTGGTTSSAECGSSSEIVRNEINGTNLVSVEIGDCVTSIGTYAFYNNSSLTSCTIGNSVTSIGSQAFTQCYQLNNINIPSSVTNIDYYAFGQCRSLTSIDIPDSVTTIGNSAFNGCSGLTSVIIGSGVTSIGERCFFYCTSLTSITCLATTPPYVEGESQAFDGTNNCPIYVPSGSVDTYKAANGWKDYKSRIQAIPVPTPTLQWVTFSNGDTIPSDLEIYGIKGVINDLSRVFYLVDDGIYVELDKGKYNVYIGDYARPCYVEDDIASNTSVEYTFSNIGCSDSYTVSSKTIANMSNDIQLLIYA